MRERVSLQCEPSIIVLKRYKGAIESVCAHQRTYVLREFIHL